MISNFSCVYRLDFSLIEYCNYIIIIIRLPVPFVQGLNAQSVEASPTLDKLSPENDEGYEPLYHPGRSIESTTEVDGLRQLFSPGMFCLKLHLDLMGGGVVRALP